MTATSERIATVDGWDEICRCDGICECGQDDGRTDESHRAEWDAVDADRTEVTAW